MTTVRRSFLRLIGAAGVAAVSQPALALADRIRILPEAGGATSPVLAGQPSPELQRALGGLTLGPSAAQGGLAVLWLQARDGRGGSRLFEFALDKRRGAALLFEGQTIRLAIL